MNIVFFGTSEIGVETLRSLNVHFNVKAVLTTQDKQGKRNKTLIESPIKQEARELNLSVLQPQKLDVGVLEQIKNCQMGVLFSYGKIIPQNVIDAFKYGILNIHPSILPKYRGASPIISALLNGDTHTGISIISLTKDLDAGDILMQKIIEIKSDDNNITLSGKISQIASQMIVCAVEYVQAGLIKPIPQKGNISYVKKFDKSDARINFETEDAVAIVKKVKAFAGYLEAFFRYNGKIYKILKASVVDKNSDPGTVIEVSKSSLVIACKNKSISIEEIKQEGKNSMPIRAFLAGYKIQCGQKLI
ncbi:Methionyl-tRNA formyltransferase [Desulfurella amilsii]|uniref:Methionyl-tRNA formyltransferase n=1 Tax=Desulfurella amilsii TaxID=1562698 RepID=A0A1X4XXA7_9BACT|nr:methionyl-tRNA formyltransferase [Desulfurella amilsii]OSS42177.1 Methionyl-tRNA formyltransferase [Desulfurella amilsii]